MKKNKFKKYAAEFKNEAELEEELDEDMLDKDEMENEHFNDEDSE